MRNLFVAVLLVIITISCSQKSDPAPNQQNNSGSSGNSSSNGNSNTTPPTYSVGPSQTIKKLQDIVAKLKPGDIVEVDGNAEYTGGITLSVDGTADKPIVIRGKKVNGKRPVIREGNDRVIIVNSAFTSLEGLEVAGKTDETTKAGIGVYANKITIRDCVIHDCRNGILGYGSDTGDVLVEYCDIYNCGGEPKGSFDFAHQIYMATDEVAFPNAVFRLQHCYIHNAKGGNDVKSRSGRNEIYYNWIEGAKYHALDLIGPDLSDNDDVTVTTKREDSDVVGNVLFAASGGSAARIGGDGTGATFGRYRFVNNTFILANNGDALRGQDDIESAELHNNIFNKSGSQADIFSESGISWVNNQRQVKGSNNFIQTGSSNIPAGLTGTIAGASLDFVDAAAKNFKLKSSSGAVNTGTESPQSFANAFPNPLFPPAFHPSLHMLEETGKAETRPVNGTIDIGAFEQ